MKTFRIDLAESSFPSSLVFVGDFLVAILPSMPLYNAVIDNSNQISETV
jgi:hypothetical protein